MKLSPAGRFRVHAAAWTAVLASCVLVGAALGGSRPRISGGLTSTFPDVIKTSQPGTLAVTAIGPAGNNNTGINFPAANTIDLVTGGVLACEVTSTSAFTCPTAKASFGAGVAVADGNATTPGLSFSSSSSTGISFPAGSTLGLVCGGAICGTMTSATAAFPAALTAASLSSSNSVNTTTQYNINTRVMASTAGVSISSGFGTSPSIATNSSHSFLVTIGSGGVATSGILTLPAASAGWNCACEDITTTSATVFRCKKTAGTTTSVTLGTFNTSAAAAAWVASDVLEVTCWGR